MTNLSFDITPHASLRELRPEDAPGMLEWMHDETIAQVFTQRFQDVTLQDALAFIEGADQDPHMLHLAIRDEHDEYMGTVSLKHIDEHDLNAEYAISTRAKAHGTGLAKKATEEILAIAFDELGLNKVYLNVKESNARAVGFYRKMGFVEEGCARQQMRTSDGFVDLLWFGILKDEFNES